MFSLFKKTKNNHSIENGLKPTPNFDDTIAKNILNTIKNEFGLDYSKQEYITLRKIERFALKNEIYDFSELEIKLTTSSELKEKLINMLTVGETYFYRELGHFKILAETMKKQSIQRILCAPSSSGEEPYSILLFLQEYFSKIPNIQITGIDINSDAIKAAQKACYSQRSVSLLPHKILKENFIYKDSKYSLHADIKKHVTFQKQNIFDTTSLANLGRFDIIFCRNMLIYFNEQQKKIAIQNLKEILIKQGILFIGHADISFEPNGFNKIHTKEGTYLYKL